MYSISLCAAIHGIEGCIVEVEADISNGLPGFSLVGFLSGEVKEARERVQIAIRNAGFKLPPKKITINLSPANIKKGGTGYDLAIAISILTAFGYIPQDKVKQILCVGELGFDGEIKEVHGILPRVFTAWEHGITCCIVPKANVSEAKVVEKMKVYGATNLKELVERLVNDDLREDADSVEGFQSDKYPDFSEIHGQTMAKRAAEIAAAGRHNLLMIGPPGSGKTMIAQRIPGIMPELDFHEIMEISKVYSVAGLLSKQKPCIRIRPFRQPHHSVTMQAMVGGGRVPKPGEISLASGGVLFLDEFPEFKREAIESLRQPLEEGQIQLTRLDGNYTYPAKCQLIAAMNPCRCGFYPDRRKCQCTDGQIRAYLSKVSQPILERIDICVETTPVSYDELTKANKNYGESSKQIRKRVMQAKLIQKQRFERENYSYNAYIHTSKIDTYCQMTKEALEFVENSYQEMDISVRIYHKILKVARTIADLDESHLIQKKHITEAFYFRMMNQKYWGR